jgi:hypothetical protein
VPPKSSAWIFYKPDGYGYGYLPYSITSLWDDQESINRFMCGTVLHDGLNIMTFHIKQRSFTTSQNPNTRAGRRVNYGKFRCQMIINDIVFPKKTGLEQPSKPEDTGLCFQSNSEKKQ